MVLGDQRMFIPIRATAPMRRLRGVLTVGAYSLCSLFLDRQS